MYLYYDSMTKSMYQDTSTFDSFDKRYALEKDKISIGDILILENNQSKEIKTAIILKDKIEKNTILAFGNNNSSFNFEIFTTKRGSFHYLKIEDYNLINIYKKNEK